MKKLFFGAIAAMTLAACSQEDIESSSANEGKKLNGIEYNVSTRNQTRVTDSYSSTNLPASFKVWAVKSDGSAYIDGETITKGDGNAYAGTTKSWPGDALNFYASVNGDITVSSATSAAIKDFTVADAAANQVDLLYAATPNLTTGTVGINFHHALAQICFKAKNTNANINVTVNSVGIGGLSNKGTYTLPSTSAAKGAWSSLSGAAEYSVKLDGETLTSSVKELTSNSVANTLAVIPQKQGKLTVASGTSSIASMEKDGAYFVLNANITNAKGDTTIYSGNIYVPVALDLAEGTRYVYTLTFSTGDGGYRDNATSVIGGVSSLTYDVTVDDYVDKDSDSDMNSDNTTTEPTKETTTETVAPDVAAHVRSAKPTEKFLKNAHMLVKGGDQPFYGIASFTIPSKDGYKVKSAVLKIMSRQIKSANAINVYGMGEFTEENATYSALESTIATALTGTAVSFTMAGEVGKQYVADYAKLSDTYKALSAWENNVDVTSLVSGNSLYLLLAKPSTDSGESQFYPLNVVASDVTTINTNTGGSITSADLQPQLIVTYEATE